jgi:hypothetical protein
MKLSLDPAATAPRQITRESLVMAEWYDAHPGVRRLWAIKDAHTLRVIVTFEPTVDNDDSYPLWLANCYAWARELRSSISSAVSLEMVHEPLVDEIEIEAEGEIIAALCWRDPALLWSAA